MTEHSVKGDGTDPGEDSLEDLGADGRMLEKGRRKRGWILDFGHVLGYGLRSTCVCRKDTEISKKKEEYQQPKLG